MGGKAISNSRSLRCELVGGTSEDSKETRRLAIKQVVTIANSNDMATKPQPLKKLIKIPFSGMTKNVKDLLHTES